MTSNTESDCQNTNSIDFKNHWNTAYSKTETAKLGWYEEKSEPTLELIQKTKLPFDATILNVGSGSSTLIDDLLKGGYVNLIANDISSKGLESLKERLKGDAKNVTYIVDDLTNSIKLNQLDKVDLWNDRAVLHFFLLEKERRAYFNLLQKTVKEDGFVIISTFAMNGAKKCCGLDVHRYNSEMIKNYLGNDFELIEAFNYTFTNPNGDSRPYVYTLFKRVKL